MNIAWLEGSVQADSSNSASSFVIRHAPVPQTRSIFVFTMDKATVEKKYMKIIKTCGMLCGIWPEQNKFSKYAMRSFIYIFASTSLFTQVANLVYFYSIDLLTWQLCFMVVVIGILVKQGNYVINSKQYKELLNIIWEDWATDRAKDEFDIMHQYALRAILFSQIYVGFGFSCATLSFVEPSLMPIILDVILPKNESRDIVYCFPAYYMIDDRKYRTLISIHMVCTCYGIYYVFAGCDANYMFIVQHACGQLAVAGYRFKNAVSDLSNVKDPRDVDKIYERVLHSIRGQQRAMNFVKIIEDSHATYLYFCMGFVLIVSSVTLVKISSYTEISGEFFKDSLFFFLQILHLGFLSLQGQFILDSNNQITQSIYSALWYNANTNTQMLFAFALRSCLSLPTLSAGGLFTLNFESFSEIIKASFSYFTVLQST